MPYETLNNLPQNIRDILPEHAQEIYIEAFNNALKEYEDPNKRKLGGLQEETAYRVAWAAVKKVYEKNDKTGKWKPIREKV